MKSILILLVISLSGCASTNYFKPGISQEQFNREAYDCRTISGAGSMTQAGNPILQGMEYDQCMRQKYGYTN